MTTYKNELPASEFKAKCLQAMNAVHDEKITIVITKRGKPYAKLVPISDEQRDIFGRMKGSVTIHGDIIAPIEDEWEVNE